MANVNVRIDQNLKEEAEEIFSKLGITASTAINLFYKQVIRENGIPFELKLDVPNRKTVKAIKESEKIAKAGKKGCDNIEELKKELNV